MSFTSLQKLAKTLNSFQGGGTTQSIISANNVSQSIHMENIETGSSRQKKDKAFLRDLKHLEWKKFLTMFIVELVEDVRQN